MNNQIKEDHYVYRLRYNAVVVYVGEGRRNRIRDKYKRPTALANLWDSCTTEIVASGLTKQESLEIESEFITDEMILGNEWLINSTSSRVFIDYDLSYLSTLLKIDLQSGTFLSWVCDGTRAGYLSNKYYPTVCIDYTSYLISRVVWVLHNKQDLGSSFVIHHIDGNPLNNHPDNLMKVTYTENNIMRKSRESKDYCWYSKIHKKGDRFRSIVRLLSGKVKEITVKIDMSYPEQSARLCSEMRNNLVNTEFIEYQHLIPYLISVKLEDTVCNKS